MLPEPLQKHRSGQQKQLMEAVPQCRNLPIFPTQSHKF